MTETRNTEIAKTGKTPARRNIPPHRNKDIEFKGYTLEELRYQRALLALQAEFCKEKILVTTEKIRRRTPFSAEGQKDAAKNIKGIPGKILKGLSFLDYLTLGFTVFTSVRKIFGFFHRKKRN